MGLSPDLRHHLFFSQIACKCRSNSLFRAIKVPVRSNNKACSARADYGRNSKVFAVRLAEWRAPAPCFWGEFAANSLLSRETVPSASRSENGPVVLASKAGEFSEWRWSSDRHG